MGSREISHVLIAVIMMFVVSSFSFFLKGNYEAIIGTFVFSFFVVVVPVLAKKAVAFIVDSNVEHEVWSFYHYWIRPQDHFRKERAIGVVLPLALTVLTLGYFKCMTFLTYETRALKYRAAKRFGYYSYSEMTDWHNGLIGAAGVASLFVLIFVSYILGFEYMTKMAAFYAFFSILPFSKLDGMQIFFGSRIIWSVLAFLSFVFGIYALFL